MNLIKKFVATPQDYLKSGEVMYAIDLAKKRMHWSAKAVVGKWFISKSYAESGDLKIDPEQLLSANVKPNMVLKFGGVRLIVQSVDPGHSAVVSIVVESGAVKETGIAKFDLSQLYISLVNIVASGTIAGFSQGLELVEG